MTDKSYIDIDSLPNKLKNIKDNNCNEYKYSEQCTCEYNSIKSIEELERNEIKKAIKLYGLSNNAVNRICEELGISRASFYRKIKKYNLVTHEIKIND